MQAQSRSFSFCTPQSGNSTLTPLQHGSSSKREKFLEVSLTTVVLIFLKRIIFCNWIYSNSVQWRMNTINIYCQLKFYFSFQVAKTLFSDECLKPCPHCQHPARCHSVKGEGVCSRADCGFQFCTACLCAFHGSRECGSQSAGRRKKDILLPGSAQSKRNVRRL